MGHQYERGTPSDHREPLEPLDDSGNDPVNLLLAICQCLQQQPIHLNGPRQRPHVVVAIKVTVQLHFLSIACEHRLLIVGAQAVQRFGDDPLCRVGDLVVYDRISLRGRIGHVEDNLNTDHRGGPGAVELVWVVGQALPPRTGIEHEVPEPVDRAEQGRLARSVRTVNGSSRQNTTLTATEEGVVVTSFLARDHREINRLMEGFPVFQVQNPQHHNLHHFKKM